MKEVEVKTQKELEGVCSRGDIAIVRVGSFEIKAQWQVRAYGSSQVTAYGSSQVRAYSSSQVRAYDSSQVRATKDAAVTVDGIDGKQKVIGGVQVHYKAPTSKKAWLDKYGLKTSGIVILFKAVRKDFKSSHQFLYEPGTSPKAPDWDGGKAECGSGLHFCALPVYALAFNSEATRFVACPVKVSEIVFHKNAKYPTKVKAPRVCGPIYECDIDGKKIESKKIE